MTIEEAIEYIQEWLKDEDALNFGDREALNIAINALQEQERKKENYPEYLKAVARELKTFCEFQSDQSLRCLECYFWSDTEGCSIYNWPEYWEV